MLAKQKKTGRNYNTNGSTYNYLYESSWISGACKGNKHCQERISDHCQEEVSQGCNSDPRTNLSKGGTVTIATSNISFQK